MKVEPRLEALPLQSEAESVDRSEARRTQMRAWVYLWTAFGVWTLLFGSGVWVAWQWRNTAYLSPAAQLVGKRGIVLYQGPRDTLPVSISERTPIEEGGLLEVTTSAEAIIQLGVDNSTVRLRPGTRLRFTTMRVGRFRSDLTVVRFDQLEGAATYNVMGELPNNRELEVKTPHTPEPLDTIRLTKGEYLVWVQPSGTRLTSYTGQARADVAGTQIRLRDSRWTILGPDRPEEKRVFELPEHLLKNRDFARGFGEAWSPIDIGEKGRPDIGGKRAIVEEEVAGRLLRTLHLTRDTQKNTHNETGLRQEVNREVSAYRNVQLSMFLKVTYSSLDGGGYAGSEYPVLLKINYVAENGGDYTWARGFFYRNEEGRPTEIGEQINQGQWYRFTLDMNSLRDRPAYIASVEVMASGHDFDAQVAAVELTVE